MSLKDLDGRLPTVVKTCREDPYQRIVIPCLKEAKEFYLGTGFFGAEWVDLAKDGLLQFVKNGGKMKLLTSVKVGEEEFEAFQKGEKAKTDAVLERALFKEVYENFKKENKEWMLNYLAWMVSNDILEVRLLVHKSSDVHMYHDKISLWIDDEGNKVASLGSMNSTLNGVKNEELIYSCFSWTPEGNESISDIEDGWNYDWEGKPEEYFLLELPDIVKMDYKQIASHSNPYEENQRDKVIGLNKSKEISMRDYQKEAIDNLKNNGYCGILAMATGTGKTFTSLLAVKKIMEEKGNSFVFICVPQITLIDQWEASIYKVFGRRQVIKCAFNRNSWDADLNVALKYFNPKSPVFVIATYDSLTNPKLQRYISQSKMNFIYVFDECHKLGMPQIIKQFNPRKDSYRIGLSATPERWFDKEGTKFIELIIGPVVFEYSMEKAIDSGMLSPYNYHIVLSQLTDEEMSQFILLSDQIAKCSRNEDDNGDSLSDSLKLTLEKRAKISKKAFNKKQDFLRVFSEQKDKKGSIVYVFDEQVDDMIETIKDEFGLNVHGIVANTKPEDRKKILEGFNNGSVDVLVAIQCLDEGVDIPNCHAEYILASSTNPREFIQRRGRVLRKSSVYPNKVAEIYDFVTIAPDSVMYDSSDKMKVIKRELARVAEFVRLSKNQDDNKMIKYLMRNGGLPDYQKENPWNICDEDDSKEE